MMEFDSESLDSDEGLEFSATENADMYYDNFTPMEEENQSLILEAKIVYILLPKNIPVSRAIRLQWLLDNLNTVIVMPTVPKLNDSSNELEIVSVVPREQLLTKCNKFRVTCHTDVKFLAQSYKFVYCLDMSPSESAVDIQKGEILFDEVINCFKISLEGLCKQFTIQGSTFVFQPSIYLTVIVNTPFFISPAQQVLVKGVQITPNNLEETINFVQNQFHLIEGKIADVSALAHEQMDSQRNYHEGLVGGLFDLPDTEKVISKIPMVSPDVNFVNMLRYSMLAISLLSEHSLSHILVITDGVVAMPDSTIMELLLFQLHYDSIAISFLKVGSSFHPHSSSGYISYIDLLEFFAQSTLGTCLETVHTVKPSSLINIYHDLFLLWSFHTRNHYLGVNRFSLQNEIFRGSRRKNLLSKRQTDEKTNVSISLLLARRMREGFTIDNITYINGQIEIKLSLQWKSSIFIYYKVTSQWPNSKANNTRYEIHIAAPYEFLHDITCVKKKDDKSSYRMAIIERFWLRLSQLSVGEIALAQQLSSFHSSSVWFNLPESVRRGIRVFEPNTPLDKSILIANDTSYPKFIHFWQPICQMEGNNWRKWLHMHKISFILKHDHQLKHLTSSQRVQVVQCRQAAAALHGLLSNWASFVLIDNNIYLKLICKEPDKPPVWFCILRINSKLPCCVLHIGFLTGTPGAVRHGIVEELKTELSSLTYLASPMRSKENTCCVLLGKPLEKILIRYERMPHDFSTVIFPDGTQPLSSSLPVPSSPLTGSLFTTLSRYLYHKRWIWSANHQLKSRLSENALGRILNTLTKMRLEEGFSFAYSCAGITTMALELWMEPNATCVIQYVLFPPNNYYMESNSGSEDDGDTDEGELQLVTEVWIEPQHGRVQTTNRRINYMNDKFYYELADVISNMDRRCINSLLTMEHLSLTCQEKNRTFSLESHVINGACSVGHKARKCSKNNFLDSSVSTENESQWYPMIAPRIEHIPFNFDPIFILPLCQQTELIFSLFIETSEKLYIQKCEPGTSNRLLLDYISEDLGHLHDSELDLTKEDSYRFTRQILFRQKQSSTNPLNECFKKPFTDFNDELSFPQWRCLLKGISVTHVILTFVPATLEDLKSLIALENLNIPVISDIPDDRASSRGSNYSDVHINVASSLNLPIYVYDCPLAVLVGAYINNSTDSYDSNKDVYEDHRFKFSDFKHEDSVRLKEDIQGSPEPKSEESDNSEIKSCARIHCRTLVLAHSKSFVLALFMALHCGAYVHSSDVQSAMDQCEESITEIDMTQYIKTVCGHIKHLKDERITVRELHRALPCTDLKPIHNLIREKFFKIVTASFNPVPTNSEFYFCRTSTGGRVKKDSGKQHDSDDEMSNVSEVGELRSEAGFSVYSEGMNPRLQRMESGISDVLLTDISPLFLHLICTIRYNSGGDSNTSVRVIPTCLGELIQNIDESTEHLDKIQVTLDIFCLTLPNNVQNVIADYSSQGLRTTSFCSDGVVSLGSPISETSFVSEPTDPDPLANLTEHQRKSILLLRDEIKWLLKDEIATSLLDINPVTSDTLHFVMSHVSGSNGRLSCYLEQINLNFVFGTAQSNEKFVEEFAKITVPGYKLDKESELFYLVKDLDLTKHTTYTPLKLGAVHRDSKSDSFVIRRRSVDVGNVLHKSFDDLNDKFRDDIASQQSDISSINDGSMVGTDGGYDDDVSEDDDDFDWLNNINIKRAAVPNFWLILKFDQVVSIYFHCRFLELPTAQVGVYMEVQRAVRDAIKDLCKKVNQSLLLQSLYETKSCDTLLEGDDIASDWTSDTMSQGSRNSSYLKLKSMEEMTDESETATFNSSSEESASFKIGEFSCPVVWETHFILHPRLKTGPGRSIISRGIVTLTNILDKFSVSNRKNMFVYRDNVGNVFYLRLHENVHNMLSKMSPLRPNEYENAVTVSRSPSVTSLHIVQNKSPLTQSEISISSAASTEIRPRVRSFGEKDCKEHLTEDTLVLKVHGITEAGTDVQCDLVQVLQNRLDDAVLEFLSITLARNAMCPLTPEDVHFIQKPFKMPEIIIKLTVEAFALNWLESFTHYLRQNLLQFLNQPKYTSHYHFKDYSDTNQINHKACDDNIFIYNQSQNPSSGSRGIACIALAVINNTTIEICDDINKLKEIFDNKSFDNVISTHEAKSADDLSMPHLEFRLWKQGRVNVDNLTEKLKASVCQSLWDIVMEHFLLKPSLCYEEEEINKSLKITPILIDPTSLDLSKEIEFNIMIKSCRKQASISRRNTLSALKNKKESWIQKKKTRSALPLSSKTSRAITFESNAEQDSEEAKVKPSIELSPFEEGSQGLLTETYSKYLPEWLEYGAMLNTPAVKRHRILLNNRHLPCVTIKELLNFLPDSPKAFRATPLRALKSDSEYKYTVYTPSESLERCVIISRNFQQWKATISYKEHREYLELITPHMLKHAQRFAPSINNGVLIPRQKILWVSVDSDCILIFAYNWNKEKIDKLIQGCTNLGYWLTVRSCFLNSVTSQKLGLFHSQTISRKTFLNTNNPYAYCIGSVENMKELPKETSRRMGSGPISNWTKIWDTCKADVVVQTKCSSNDPVVVFSLEMHEIRLLEDRSREEMKKLHSMYQSRTSSATVSQIFLLMQNSRIIHYCHTPLLFLPKWRLRAAATRDHSLFPSQAIHIADNMACNEKDAWHTELCYSFFSDYRRYLQTLGFMPLQFDNNREPGIWTDNSSYNSVFYIQKTILGGILLFTVKFVQPFFTTKLHVIECNRLQNINSRSSINRFTLSFLDECDKVKISMHLHSFTYDYHLRCIHNYISNKPGARVCDKYNVNQFLDDFMKYYTKAPNFARNLIHADTLTIKELITEGKQLYDYLLDNVDQYNFKVFEMHRTDDIEHILVQVTSTPQFSYKDSQDREHTDDFDVTLVVYNLCIPYDPTDNILHLKFYLILTSKRDIYPKTEVEQKLGKFRTVSSTARSLSGLEKGASDTENNRNSDAEAEAELTNSDEHEVIFNNDPDNLVESDTGSIGPNTALPYVEISQESVNYLGYYSSHEQLMQQLILDKALATQKYIKDIVAKGMIHCRTNLLWNKLVSSQDSNGLSFTEFVELKSLANLENLCDVHPTLGPLLNQPLPWYEGLAKLLLQKYNDYKRTYFSVDGNIQHYVILHPAYFGAFMLLSLDLHIARGDLYAVYRELNKQEDVELNLAYRKQLLDGFINCISFYLWAGMI